MLECLLGVCHGCDTLLNESLNDTVSWYAQKNQTCSLGHSLSSHVGVAVSLCSLGTLNYYSRLSDDALGMEMTDGVRHYLDISDKTWTGNLARRKLAAKKAKRKQLYRET